MQQVPEGATDDGTAAMVPAGTNSPEVGFLLSVFAEISGRARPSSRGTGATAADVPCPGEPAART